MSNAFEPEAKRSFVEFARALRRDRDRVRIQLNLAQKEIKEEWEKIEDKWDAFEGAMMNASDGTNTRSTKRGKTLRQPIANSRNVSGWGRRAEYSTGAQVRLAPSALKNFTPRIRPRLGQ